MSERALQEARAVEALAAARARLLESHPFFATLALQLDLVPVWDDRVPTAATDGARIYLRPSWILEQSAATHAFVLAHEVGHCALGHLRRATTGESELWNVAMDQEVNALLRADGLMPDCDHVYVPDLDGLSAEQVFDRLRDDGALPVRGPDADVHLPVSPPTGGERDPRFQPELREAVFEDWSRRVREAERRLRSAGRDPGRTARIVVGRLQARALPWRRLLADFVTRRLGGASTWLPPSRRHVHRGLYLPSRRSDHLRVAVAVDTSGSTEPYLPAFVSEVMAILSAFPRFDLTWIACDEEVRALVRYDHDTPPDPEELPLHGGGGTSLLPPFEALCDLGEPPTVLVYLTDGHGPAPAVAPPWPVLWVLTPRGRRPADWGEVAWLDIGDSAVEPL